MSTSPIKINLQAAHDHLGRLARDAHTLECHIREEHPELYEDIALELDGIISRVYHVRGAIRRYNYEIFYKSIFQ